MYSCNDCRPSTEPVRSGASAATTELTENRSMLAKPCRNTNKKQEKNYMLFFVNLFFDAIEHQLFQTLTAFGQTFLCYPHFETDVHFGIIGHIPECDTPVDTVFRQALQDQPDKRQTITMGYLFHRVLSSTPPNLPAASAPV